MCNEVKIVSGNLSLESRVPEERGGVEWELVSVNCGLVLAAFATTKTLTDPGHPRLSDSSIRNGVFRGSLAFFVI